MEGDGSTSTLWGAAVRHAQPAKRPSHRNNTADCSLCIQLLRIRPPLHARMRAEGFKCPRAAGVYDAQLSSLLQGNCVRTQSFVSVGQFRIAAVQAVNVVPQNCQLR